MASHLLYLRILLYLNINLHTHTLIPTIHDLQHGNRVPYFKQKLPNPHPPSLTPHLHSYPTPPSTLSVRTAQRTQHHRTRQVPLPTSMQHDRFARLLHPAAPLSCRRLSAPWQRQEITCDRATTTPPGSTPRTPPSSGRGGITCQPTFVSREPLSVYCVLVPVFSESGENGASGKLGGPAETILGEGTGEEETGELVR